MTDDDDDDDDDDDEVGNGTNRIGGGTGGDGISVVRAWFEVRGVVCCCCCCCLLSKGGGRVAGSSCLLPSERNLSVCFAKVEKTEASEFVHELNIFAPEKLPPGDGV